MDGRFPIVVRSEFSIQGVAHLTQRQDFWHSLPLENRSVITISQVTLTRAIAMALKAFRHIIGKSTMECVTSEALHQNYQPAYEVHLGSEYHGVYDDLRDAIAAGKLLRSTYLTGAIGVIDSTSGFPVIDID